jgi:hypothetical protein
LTSAINCRLNWSWRIHFGGGSLSGWYSHGKILLSSSKRTRAFVTGTLQARLEHPHMWQQAQVSKREQTGRHMSFATLTLDITLSFP